MVGRSELDSGEITVSYDCVGHTTLGYYSLWPELKMAEIGAESRLNVIIMLNIYKDEITETQDQSKIQVDVHGTRRLSPGYRCPTYRP